MIVSFGFKKGRPPARVGKVFDVQTLTHDTNRDDFIRKQHEIIEWGREHPGADIAIGCEQGQHRSVVLAKRVAAALHTGYYTRDKRASRK